MVKFKRGRTSVENDPRQGRSKTATRSEIGEKIQDIILDKRRVTETVCVEALGISF